MGILVNNAQVIQPNILTQTGVIHVIDQGMCVLRGILQVK